MVGDVFRLQLHIPENGLGPRRKSSNRRVVVSIPSDVSDDSLTISGAMENWGLITFKSARYYYNKTGEHLVFNSSRDIKSNPRAARNVTLLVDSWLSGYS